jgi:hypothetical protein
MLRAFASLACFALTGCQCKIDDTNLDNIPDAGVEEPDAGPPPPVFPLKAGDQLKYTGLGGRTATCEAGGTSGECQRALNATFVVKDTLLDGTWTVVADALYEGSDDTIDAAAIAPLVLENGVPFGQVTMGTPLAAEDASFKTNAAATDELNALGFPFFQGGAVEVFEPTGTAFCARYTELDELANCESQFGAHKMDVYYKDEQAGGGPKLHKVQVEYSQFGFVCGWDEGIIPFISEEETPRDQGSFGGGENFVPDVAAQFTGSPSLTRDGVEYRCQCLSQQCRNQASNMCLSIDPAEPAAPCE